MTSPALIYNDKFSSNITYEQYSVIDVNINEVNCKLRKYIYLLICTDCGVQYVGGSIRPLKKRTNIHRNGKSKYEISINLCKKKICKNAFLLCRL